MAANECDELGQLVRKNVGGADISGQASLQKVDYKYNIRGWLKSINDVEQLNPASDPADLFAFKIMYNEVEHNFGNEVKPLFNGNISQTFWKTDSDNVRRSYGYKYDDLNRLLKGIYQRDDAVTHSYDENLNYDKNGNITNLYRNGYFDSMVPGVTYPIDELTYSYGSHSNQLSGVYDNTNSVNGFKDGNPIGVDYNYDDFGNMTIDRNKGIESILYNHLNLPTLITFENGSIRYLYNAVGVKVAKIVSTTSTSQSTLVSSVAYLGGFQYNNNELQFFPTAEGYVSVTGGNSFNYVYNYTDHLGNIRLSYTQSGTELKILEENHYYPFGLKHSNYNLNKKQWTKYDLVAHEAHNELVAHDANVTSKAVLREVIPSEYKYKYKYNGKEFQDELGLNVYAYGWRDYDPAIGRFQRIDRFAEKYHSLSPYGYAANNPIYYVDVQGDSLKVANTQITKDYLNSAVNKSNQKYIKYDDNGNVSLDFGDVSAKAQKRLLKQDEGLAVINNMVNAKDGEGNSENYFFEISNQREGIDGDGVAFNMKVELTSGKSISGFETGGYEWFANYSTTNYSNKQHENVKPKAGIDGAVFISPGKVYEYITGPPSSMGNYVKHELRENYFRTHEGKPYSEAHPAAGGKMSFSKFIFD